jgi:glutaredoxin 3
MAVKDIVEQTIAGHTVTIFSKSHCGFCRRVKTLFSQNFPEVDVKVLELDELDDGSLIQDYLVKKTGQRTVPNVFIKQQHIGGCDDIVNLNMSGQLKSKLA